VKHAFQPVPPLPAGFTLPSADIPQRALFGTQGMDRTGKSDFWLRNAPDPVAYINLDIGLEGVIEKFVRIGRKLWGFNYNIPPLDGSTDQRGYKKHYDNVRDAYFRALDHKDVRTIVFDRADQMWELMRLAEFGQLNPAADIKKAYLSLNQLYKSFIRKAYDTDKSLVLVHGMKRVYSRRKDSQGRDVDTWEGLYDRMGFGESAYLIQSNLEHYFIPGDNTFGVRILNCRQNPSVTGMTFEGDLCNFAEVAAAVFENSPKDWE